MPYALPYTFTTDRLRDPVRRALLDDAGPLVIPAPVTAEIDSMLGVRHGTRARRAFLADLAAGRFSVACLEREDHQRVVELETRYEDLGLGLADCSLVVAAYRFRTTRLLTFDKRRLRAVVPIQGGSFTLVPADA